MGSTATHVVSRYSASIVKMPLALRMRDVQVDCTWLLCLLDFHRLQKQAWTLEAEDLQIGLNASSVTVQLCDLEQVPPVALFLHL